MRLRSFLLLVLACLSVVRPMAAQTVGKASVAGRVVDAKTNAPIANAQVQIGAQTTTTDSLGQFTLTDLTEGRHLLAIVAGSHQSKQEPITLAAEARTLPAIGLEPEIVTMDRMVVAGQSVGATATFDVKGSTDALTEVVSGAALKSATAQSASDLLKNVSGVSVTTGADGAANVTVRGMDSRFVRVTIDGQRQTGAAALASIPPEIIQSLEVSKALTPDQDADAIGGAINVTTGTTNLKDAYVQGRQQLTYNSLEPRPGTRNSVTVARPFTLLPADGTKRDAGFLLTASFDDQYRTRENIRDLREWPPLLSPGPAPYSGQLVPVLTQPRIEQSLEHRQRTALVFNADAHFEHTSFFWRSNVARDWSNRDRRIDDFDPAVGTPVVLTPDYAVFSGVPQNRRDMRQVTQQDTANFSFGGKTSVGRIELDGSLGLALSDQSEPLTLETIFASRDTFLTTYDTRNTYLPRFTLVDEANPANPASISDPAAFNLSTLTVTHADTRDREIAARLNATLSLDGAGQASYLKFGGKLQQRHRDSETQRWNYDPGTQPLSLVGLVGVPMVTLHSGQYRYGPIPDAAAVEAQLLASPAAFQLDQTESAVNSLSGDYTATETIGAAYGMGRFKFGRWTTITGVRVEDTRIASQGNQLVFGPDGSLQSITPAQVSRTYLQVLPGLHVRFDPQPTLIVRTSVTRALNRPSYSEITPVRTLNFLDRRSRTGNPDLKPYQSTNFDLAFDKYTDNYGLFSLGLFYKKIDHFIEDAQYPTTIGDFGQFIEFKRINGAGAHVAGLETGWQSRKWTLPAALGMTSFTLNAILLQSLTKFPDRPNDRLPLDGQQGRQFNLVWTVERNRLTWEAALRYRSKNLEDVIAPGFDNYKMGAFDGELNLAYDLQRDLRLSAGISNIFNMYGREYSGTRSHMNQFDRQGVDFVIGVQWKLPMRASLRLPSR